MKKKQSHAWAIVLAIVFGLSAIGNFSSVNYEGRNIVFPITAALAVTFAFVYWKLHKEAEKQQMEEYKRKQEEAEAAREAYRQKMEAERARFKRHYFPIAGVTFQNEDKTDRQKILRAIATTSEIGATEAWMEQDENGGILVVTDEGAVGHIRRSDKAEVQKFFDKPVNSMYLQVEQFTPDDGDKPIYRADLIISVDLEKPEQAEWYREVFKP